MPTMLLRPSTTARLPLMGTLYRLSSSRQPCMHGHRAYSTPRCIIMQQCNAGKPLSGTSACCSSTASSSQVSCCQHLDMMMPSYHPHKQCGKCSCFWERLQWRAARQGLPR